MAASFGRQAPYRALDASLKMASERLQKSRAIKEFGDFQTPIHLAKAATRTLLRLGVHPRSILEPTCGKGAFVTAAAESFPNADAIYGIEINCEHLAVAIGPVLQSHRHVILQQGDFFKLDWHSIVTPSKGPWLILGNPPWVTSAELGSIESANLPAKANFHGRAGIEAITGKSNFDISEWMLLRYLNWLEDSEGTIAILCKTSVARKILLHLWKAKKQQLHSARMYKIDALKEFGAAVDACFFVIEIRPDSRCTTCDVFADLTAIEPSHTLGYLDGHIITDALKFNVHRNLLGTEERYVWRSGIKHDCSKIMELGIVSNGYRNGLGELISLEESLLYPLFKSSDISNGRMDRRNVMVVTQQVVGEDTNRIRTEAPETWRYLSQHESFLDKRASVVYKNKPRFSIFGVGPYTFSPWKVAISGFYKKLQFVKVGPIDGKPAVFDDTVYFLPCWSQEEAEFLESLLQSEPATNFLQSMIHWEEKRPVTIDILKRLSIRSLATLLEREDEYLRFTGGNNLPLFNAIETEHIRSA
jgi:methylase of polypeptide subunit release factors